MLKILLKKQFAEFLAGLSRNRRSGKQRTGGGLVLYILLLVFIGISLAASFTAMFFMFAKPMIDAGFGYVYFAFSGVLTAMIGLIGGTFVTYGVIYCPKDNEALLAMPIPPSTILLARMLFAWIQILLYTSTSALPAIVLAQIFGGFSIGLLLLQLLMYLLMTLFLLAISCGLGWLLAVIAAKTGKKAVTVVSIIVSLGAYFFFYFGRQRITEMVMSDPAGAGNFFKKWLWPFYAYGCGSMGKGVEAALFGTYCCPSTVSPLRSTR
jgi:ABC-2 type transport system permease protein